MSGSIHKTGNARNTDDQDVTSIQLFDFWHVNIKGLGEFASITSEEIEGDSLSYLMVSFTQWGMTTTVPQYWKDVDGELLPRNPENTNILSAERILQYAGKVLARFRSRFPTHPDFAGLSPQDSNAVPSWWSTSRVEQLKLGDRHRKLLGSDFTFGSNTTRPIYADNTEGEVGMAMLTGISDDGDDYVVEDGKQILTDMVSAIDLKSICCKLLKGSTTLFTPSPYGKNRYGSLQRRSWLATLLLAAGRPGEVKFVDMSNWAYNPFFQALDIKWFEMKKLIQYAMPMIASRLHFALDYFHAIGSYWLVEGGLHRIASQDKVRFFLYPLLHSVQDNTVSSLIKDTIRDNLPGGTPDSLAKEFNGRSIRCGSITNLVGHPETSHEENCAVSGHSLASTIDTYTDKSNLALGLPGIRALNGYMNVHRQTRLPRLKALGQSPEVVQSLSRLVEAMFEVSKISITLTAFHPTTGHLYVVLKTCAASLLMHYSQLVNEFTSSNAVASKIVEAAESANIIDNRFNDAEPATLLPRWGDIILKDFKQRNPEISSASPDMMSIAANVNQQNPVMLEILSEVRALRRSYEESEVRSSIYERKANENSRECREVRAENKELRREIDEIRHQYNKLAPIAANMKTPEKLVSSSDVASSRASYDSVGGSLISVPARQVLTVCIVLHRATFSNTMINLQ